MKICISAQGDNMDSLVDPRFGRCVNFIIFDNDTQEVKVLANDAAFASTGAGIAAAQTVVNAGAKVVLTGNLGPNAWKVLSSSGVQVYSVAGISAREACAKYADQELTIISAPTSPGHHGGR